MKYSAPIDTSSIFLSCGQLAVVEGVVTIPDDVDLTEGDRIGLAANGFAPIVGDTAPVDAPTDPVSSPAEDTDSTPPADVAPIVGDTADKRKR